MGLWRRSAARSAVQDVRDHPELLRARRRLLAARRVLVLTGAGISASAGLPTFRGPGGLYGEGLDIPAFMRAEQLPGSVDALWRFWGTRRAAFRAAEPTAAHRAMAAWQERCNAEGTKFTLVTTNGDDLHERAGSGAVHHLHGQLFASVCTVPACSGRMDRDFYSGETPPSCPVCSGPMRVGLVLFGDPVDIDALWAAKRAVRECDAFLAVGTSSSVYPGNGLTRYARDVGAFSVLVNPTPGTGDGFDAHLRLPADVAVPALLDA